MGKKVTQNYEWTKLDTGKKGFATCSVIVRNKTRMTGRGIHNPVPLCIRF